MSVFLRAVSPIRVSLRVPPLVHSTQEAEVLEGILRPIALVPLTLQAPDNPSGKPSGRAAPICSEGFQDNCSTLPVDLSDECPLLLLNGVKPKVIFSGSSS